MASAARFTRSRSFRNTVSRGVSALLFPHGPHLKSNGEGHRLSSLVSTWVEGQRTQDLACVCVHV